MSSPDRLAKRRAARIKRIASAPTVDVYDWLLDETRVSRRGKIRKSVRERFMSKFTVAPNGCWEWKGAKCNAGYALLAVRDRMMKASRLSWMLFHGRIPEGMVMCHRCDNPSCVCPDHLFPGTNQDNTQDALSKERMLIGEANGQHKLTEHDVLTIRLRRSRGESVTAMATEYKVHPPAISRIANNQRWKHLPSAAEIESILSQ